jgi:hypothetical protein
MDHVEETKSVLVADMLNVVGENHPESNARRALEKQFVLETIGSTNYWTENEFKDQYGGRVTKDSTKKKEYGEGADLMEFRAAMATAFLVVAFEGLCDEAGRVGAITDDTAGAALTAFVTVNVANFAETKEILARKWTTTPTDEVNTAVQAIGNAIDTVLGLYKEIMQKATAHGSIKHQLQATTILAGKRAQVTAFLPQLCVAVGVPGSTNAETLYKLMIEERSKYMGLGASFAGQTGVWKVGDHHIRDLMNELNVDTSHAHIVSREDFNKEFEAWKRRKGYK